ncbi:Beta-glucosidase [Drechslerella dactyloides]|uniref:Probable beta-glucosidase E n=1 Tax=Drechslerella dactyloides TaxID=74499 RepID=A0AAD6IY62_DREDA|nr:Beta-glucosidase [Drechslerella dactyloides]
MASVRQVRSRRSEEDDAREALLARDGTSSPKSSFEKERERVIGAAQGKKTSRKLVIGSGIVSVVLVVWGIVMYKPASQFFYPSKVKSPPHYPSPKGGTVKEWEESYKKAHELVSKMTLAEKVNITTGTGWSMDFCVGNTGPATFAGFPSLCYQDGPLGIRFADHSTAFPAGLTVAATWNRDLMYARGEAHATEAHGKGINILLGPAMGPLGRHPAGGRNWEGFSPDPYLTGEIEPSSRVTTLANGSIGICAAETIKGIQSTGIIATAKHWLLNEQEHYRQAWEWGTPSGISSNVDDRTLHELYAWPFADSVKAGVGSIMCSYNKVNNTYACENSKLLNGILKDELGFQGFVQSDWLAQRSGVTSALTGLDVTMPGDGLRWHDGDSLWGGQLSLAVLNTSMPLDRFNDMVTRVVATWYQLGQDDETRFPKDFAPNFSSWVTTAKGPLHFGSDQSEPLGITNKFIDVQADHKKIARAVATEGTVLVKNDDKTLPLNAAELRGKIGIYGSDAGPSKEGANECHNRACNSGTLGSGWGSGAVDFPYMIDPLQAITERLKDNTNVELTSILDNFGIKDVKKSAAQQDLCLAFINADSGEGFEKVDGIKGDRNDLLAQRNGDALVRAVVENCKATVVVIHSVGTVTVESFVEHKNLKSLIFANLPGQESGNALADILFGDINPSGKMPYTVGKSLEDYGPGAPVMYYPNALEPQANFSEGFYIDYRHFDKQNIEPRFAFGHGLSYTTFKLSGLSFKPLQEKSAVPAPPPASLDPPAYPATIPPVAEATLPAGFRKINKYVYPYIDPGKKISTEPAFPYPEGYDVVQPKSAAGGGEGGNPALWEAVGEVSFEVENTGDVTGKEVVQLYIGFPTQEPRMKTGDADDAKLGDFVDFPVRQLRGFEKVELKKGEKATVKLTVKRRDVSYWCVVRQNWIMPTTGQFIFHVGHSSRDLPLKVTW